MPYDAKIVEVMIAAPSDVLDERAIVRDALADWNAVHSRDRKVALLPVGWDTHSIPDLGGRPQKLINERVLANADILVGIFWTKIGSPTGKSISGSVEEIEEHRRLGKPVMLYFSTQPAHPDSINPEQYASLRSFREWAKGEGIVVEYGGPRELEKRFARDLQVRLLDSNFWPAREKVEVPFLRQTLNLSADGKTMLLAAAADKNGMVLMHRGLNGVTISAGQKAMCDPEDRRATARWSAVVDELVSFGLIKDTSDRYQIFELTDAGYQVADIVMPFN